MSTSPSPRLADGGIVGHLLVQWQPYGAAETQAVGQRFFQLRVRQRVPLRGTQDILIAVVDGLKGFPEAITSVFPRAVVQTCIVHLIRCSMHFAAWKERRPVALALKPIYQAESATVARERLEDFDRGPWGQKYPAIAQSWRRN